jgi:sulfite exporter TauE/SafE
MFLFASFLLGIASSFHCLGMCGPIAMALPLDRSSNSKKLLGISAYNFGRITTYSLLGLLFGSIGFSIQIYRIFQILSVVLGIGLILIAWRKQLIGFLEIRKVFFYAWLNKSMGKLLSKRGTEHLFFLGMLNGILPCGLIFIALASSLLADSIWESGLAMFVYGLGTTPSMFMVAYFAQSIGNKLRLRISQAFPYLMTCIGILVILRGANLGIPYVSPLLIENKSATHVEGNEPKTIQVMCHAPSQQKQEQKKD